MDAADLFGDASDISDDEGDAEAAAPAKRVGSDDDDVRRGSDYEEEGQDPDQPRAVIQVRPRDDMADNGSVFAFVLFF